MENEKLDNLFNINKMEKSVKKAKRKANGKIVFITLIVLCSVTIVVALLNSKMTMYFESKVRESTSSLYEISKPNKFIGKYERYPGLLGGESHFTTYKIIEGKVVYTGEDRFGYGLFRNEILPEGTAAPEIIGFESNIEEDLQSQLYNELGQREMVFFYPSLQYKTYRNDLTLLDEIGENKVMEVALSFDRSYTFEEVKSMIPNQLHLTWLWVDDIDEKKDDLQSDMIDVNKGKVIGKQNQVRSEHSAYGVSLIDENGQPIEDPVQNFISEIKMGKDFKTIWQADFQNLYKTLSGEDGKLTEDDLQFLGAVVTGDAKTLSTLKKLPFIKASSIGVITDKY